MDRIGKVPLTEVGEHSDKIRLLDFDLPGTDPERLAIDIARTERVMHWGGIGHLSLGSYEGERTTFAPANPRLNPDGTLSATRSKLVTKASASSLEQTPNKEHPAFRQRNLALYFNKNQPPGRQEKPIQGLDRNLRSQLFKDIWRSEAGPLDLAFELGIIAYYIHVFNDISTAIIVKSLGTMPMIYTVRSIFTNSENPHKKSSQLFWYGDRAAIASAYLARPLITPIK